ncbi:Bug family tripartite tricarboxylate transporter substrate binding protein [Ottowia thiooxydans]|uniref:Bug family tripartite tricarboxylate transporter substrate binding protein n=1 Tax=Ottowia thiooxydans TaxID=219182 RepID=UPI0003FF005B|nr:tripartite tricarboxylate transporter substrate binding protein [Ottowia thiooxydans]
MIQPLRLLTASCVLAVMAGTTAQAQTYPTQAVRLVVPFGAGGVTDITARVFAEGLSRELGQPFVVENRAGAAGGIAGGLVAKARPDGYTLLVITNGMFAVNPLIYPSLAYDPKKDFTYVAMLANTPTILAVNPSSPFPSLPELVKAAATENEKLSFSTAGEGSDNYQVLQLLQQATGTQFLAVPYKSGTESLTAVINRTADATAISAVSAVSFVDSKQIRPFAVTSSKRLANFPDIPTVKEVLGKSVEGGSLSGLAAPAGTPAEVVKRLNAAIAKVAGSQLVHERIYSKGSEPVDPSQTAFEKRVRDEQAKWAGLLKPVAK